MSSERNEDPMQEEKERTMYIANLHEKVTEELLYELFVQAGPLQNVKLVSGNGKPSFGFITFKHECSVPYTLKLMSGLSLYGRQLQLKPRAGTNTEKKIREEEKKAGMSSRSRPTPSSRNPPAPERFYPHQQLPWQVPVAWNGPNPNFGFYGTPSIPDVPWGPPFNSVMNGMYAPSPPQPPPPPREIPLERYEREDEEIIEVDRRHGRDDYRQQRSHSRESRHSSYRRQSSDLNERQRSRDNQYDNSHRSYQPYDRNSRY